MVSVIGLIHAVVQPAVQCALSETFRGLSAREFLLFAEAGMVSRPKLDHLKDVLLGQLEGRLRVKTTN